MKKSFSACITIIGLCFLLAGISFADGGGVKSVDPAVYGANVNPDCESGVLKCPNGGKYYIEGYFTAHQEEKLFIAHISLEEKVDTPFNPSTPNKKLYYIPIPYDYTKISKDPNTMNICEYTESDLMDRFEAFACKKRLDRNYGQIQDKFQAWVEKIYITSQFNCNGDIYKENKPMISGTVTIQICPLKP